MPFMKGRSAVRYTIDYLEKGSLVFKENIKVLTVNYNTGQASSLGAYKFAFWNIPQVQYKNPEVQILRFKNLTPSPFFQFFFDSGDKIVMDVDSCSREDIHQQIKKVFCKSAETLQQEAIAAQKLSNTANFGGFSLHQCMCEIPGQVHCPGWKELPKEMRGKYKFAKKEDSD